MGVVPGEVLTGAEPVELFGGRPRVTATVANTGDRPVQVGSHYHFAEANPALAFDRAAARGYRLAVPAGTSVRFEPGIERSVELVPLAGRRVVAGLRGEVAGPLDRAVPPPEGTAPGTVGGPPAPANPAAPGDPATPGTPDTGTTDTTDTGTTDTPDTQGTTDATDTGTPGTTGTGTTDMGDTGTAGEGGV